VGEGTGTVFGVGGAGGGAAGESGGRADAEAGLVQDGGEGGRDGRIGKGAVPRNICRHVFIVQIGLLPATPPPFLLFMSA
jgi:hypothetical protein